MERGRELNEADISRWSELLLLCPNLSYNFDLHFINEVLVDMASGRHNLCFLLPFM